ncbi:hypothetical protein JTE90_011043 [Oedothorax gibbosus]|uniref:Uncharacterized protein n=1 Tax=Oedothorax gibbosus TaxID=931172 RepID=A0AAV6VCR9_9ARAC|nr:hypothetical protein JTE90_011043 [Oedothorax gibbosus]
MRVMIHHGKFYCLSDSNNNKTCNNFTSYDLRHRLYQSVVPKIHQTKEDPRAIHLRASIHLLQCRLEQYGLKKADPCGLWPLVVL